MENEAEGGQQGGPEGWGSLKVLKGIQRGSGLPIEETVPASSLGIGRGGGGECCWEGREEGQGGEWGDKKQAQVL